MGFSKHAKKLLLWQRWYMYNDHIQSQSQVDSYRLSTSVVQAIKNTSFRALSTGTQQL